MAMTVIKTDVFFGIIKMTHFCFLEPSASYVASTVPMVRLAAGEALH